MADGVTGSPAEHARVIRQSLAHSGYCPYPASSCECTTSIPLAALAVLERQAEEAEEAKADLRAGERAYDNVHERARVQWVRAEAAEARVQQLEEALRPFAALPTPLALGHKGIVCNLSREDIDRARAVLVVPSPPDSKEGK